MHRLTTALGMPQHRFASIHVVGTNGKSSVTRMTAALLEAHGTATGAYLSPHAGAWSERLCIRGRPAGPEAFATAVERTAEAARTVDRTLDEGERVTQFEAATATAFVALAAARVRCGVIEAGLGGRLDATNVIPSQVTVLTSVGLEHTDWLGSTEAEIAAEKLAVLRDHSALVLGRLSPEVRGLAERAARERGARLVDAAAEDPRARGLRAPGGFQRRNFSVALAAAEAYLGELDPESVAAVARDLAVPGRLEPLAADPPSFLDAAHNPAGAAALAEALPEVSGGRPVCACIALLADKDAAGFLDALAPAVGAVVCTELPEAWLRGAGRPGARSRPAAELAALAAERGLEAVARPDPEAALRECRELARRRDGVALAAGSHGLLGAARAAWAEG